jgi:hypothetical protein
VVAAEHGQGLSGTLRAGAVKGPGGPWSPVNRSLRGGQAGRVLGVAMVGQECSGRLPRLESSCQSAHSLLAWMSVTATRRGFGRTVALGGDRAKPGAPQNQPNISAHSVVAFLNRPMRTGWVKRKGDVGSRVRTGWVSPRMTLLTVGRSHSSLVFSSSNSDHTAQFVVHRA